MSMRIVGYSDRLSVEHGDEIAFMVSTEETTYHAEMVRLIHGDDNPAGPGFKSVHIPSSVDGDHEGLLQVLRPGSYVRVPHREGLDTQNSFTIQLWMWPTTPDRDTQTLFAQRGTSGDGYALSLENSYLTLRIGETELTVQSRVEARVWHFVSVVFDANTGDVELTLEPICATRSGTNNSARKSTTGNTYSSSDIFIGGQERFDSGELSVGSFYNGKIEAPRLYNRALDDTELAALREARDPLPQAGLVAAWDFSRDISTWSVTDSSGHEFHGRAVNMPMRAATGRNWDGKETSWSHVPDQYGAIHFHDDDLSDADWKQSIQWKVPNELPSGVYALHVTVGDAEDFIPFTVRPGLGKPTAKIVLLLPTFSYLAYANERLLDTVEGMGHVDYPRQDQDRYTVENRLLSLYDTHSDGSGVCYSSRLRPIVNMRPKCVMQWLDEGRGSPHGLNADLYLVDWLYEHGFDFDVVTDEDLHHEGAQLLEPYNVVLTGTHSEYWSNEMIDAAQAYLHLGGRMMYLGGNGMYWVTQLDPETGASVEVRRRGPSTRMWEPEPGEAHLSSTGELGGIWRYRGRAPQSWLGVGFTAETSGHGRPYVRQPDSFEPDAAFVFDGIDDDELIGDLPNLVQTYGAAGYEFDRADFRLGTPAHTKILATASGYSDAAQAACEEIMTSDSQQSGSVNPLVKTDMVLLDYPDGGAVFTPGAIAWCGCLSQNGYDNNVSRVASNVLRAFASDERDFRAAAANTVAQDVTA